MKLLDHHDHLLPNHFPSVPPNGALELNEMALETPYTRSIWG